MLLALLGTLALAPVYWWVVPAGARRTAMAAASLVALACWDVRLAGLLPAVALGLWAVMQRAATSGPARARGLAAAGIAALVALFSWNKLAVDAGGFLPSQGGLVFLGASYVVLKGIAALVESVRGTYGP